MNKKENLKKIAEQRKKKERFITTRMWFSTLISMFFPDRAVIPANIGNNIFIGNNQMITKNSMSQFILIKEFSTEMEVGWRGDLLKRVKEEVPGVSVDYIVKCYPKYIKPNDSALLSRVRTWTNAITREDTSDRTKKEAARLLYTYEKLKEGERMFHTVEAIRVRAKNGLSQKMGMQIVKDFLIGKGCEIVVIKSKLQFLLEMLFLTSSRSSNQRKDFPRVMQSYRSLAESFPLTPGRLSDRGLVMGMITSSNDYYVWDFMKDSGAKNVAVYGISGKGKTHLVKNWFLDLFSMEKVNISTVDIKGQELSGPTLALGGKVVPYRTDSPYFINTLRFNKSDLKGEKLPENYCKERFDLTVRLLNIIVSPSANNEEAVDTLCNMFVKSLYIKAGVNMDNPNTWHNTLGMHPLKLAKEFKSFCNNDILKTFPVAVDMQSKFDLYLDPDGPYSTMFGKEMDLEDILSSKLITADFGMMDSSRTGSTTQIRIKTLFWSVVNDAYCLRKKQEKEFTVLIQEEAQLADSASKGSDIELMTEYANNFSMRRAQNVVNILLCNSFEAIVKNEKAAPIVSNTNILCIGAVTSSSRKLLIEEYDLGKYADILEKLHDGGPDWDYTFLVINRTKSDAPAMLIRVTNPDDVAKGILFKGVDTIE